MKLANVISSNKVENCDVKLSGHFRHRFVTNFH